MKRSEGKPTRANAEGAQASTKGADAPGRYEYAGLDRVIHERARLGVITSLAAHPKGLLFNDLKRLCGLTDGNLSRHLSVLEEAGLVEIVKGFQGKTPQTQCRITPFGRERFVAYLSQLEQVVKDAAAAAPLPHPQRA